MPRIGTTTPKGLIALTCIILAHYVDEQLEHAGNSQQFRADKYMINFNELYHEMEDLEGGGKGVEAMVDFNNLKDTLWRQDDDYGQIIKNIFQKSL